MIDRRLLKLNFKTFTSAITDLVLPRVCVVCGQELMPEERHICLECLADLPLTRFAGMSRNPIADVYNSRIESQLNSASLSPSPAVCDRREPGVVTGAEPPSKANGEAVTGAEPPSEANGVAVTGQCPSETVSTLGRVRGGTASEAQRWDEREARSFAGHCPVTIPYQYATALFYYRSDSPYRKITQALKYHRDFGAGRMFARMLGEELRDSPLYADVDLVIPVPLHWARKMKRGYNQAEVIAREVALALGSRLDVKALRRIRRTGSQVRLAGDERTGNVAGAFRASGSSALAKARHVLLIDDVFTTGATLIACYDAIRMLLPAGSRVSIATLGFVQNG